MTCVFVGRAAGALGGGGALPTNSQPASPPLPLPAQDFKKIMLQALSDRLAEAFAEWAHQRMRRDTWGYSAGEALSSEELLKQKYVGIRPAPGYPSQPDHTEKRVMWDLLKPKELAGIELTDSLAMMPASAVSALVFAAPSFATLMFRKRTDCE